MKGVPYSTLWKYQGGRTIASVNEMSWGVATCKITEIQRSYLPIMDKKVEIAERKRPYLAVFSDVLEKDRYKDEKFPLFSLESGSPIK